MSIKGRLSGRLEAVLEEAKSKGGGPARAGAAKALRDLFAAEAVVAGTVFSSGKELKVLVKLNEVRSGKVLLSAESVLRQVR